MYNEKLSCLRAKINTSIYPLMEIELLNLIDY